MAASLARAAGLMRRFFRPFAAGAADFPAAACTLAQRARWAAAMRARAAGDMVRLPVLAGAGEVEGAEASPEPAKLSNSASKASILSLSATTFRSCAELRF